MEKITSFIAYWLSVALAAFGAMTPKDFGACWWAALLMVAGQLVLPPQKLPLLGSMLGIAIGGGSITVKRCSVAVVKRAVRHCADFLSAENLADGLDGDCPTSKGVA
jgi:hypothetical protein